MLFSPLLFTNIKTFEQHLSHAFLSIYKTNKFSFRNLYQEKYIGETLNILWYAVYCKLESETIVTISNTWNGLNIRRFFLVGVG